MKKLLTFIVLALMMVSCNITPKSALEQQAEEQVKIIQADYQPTTQVNNVYTIPGNFTNYQMYEIEGVTYYYINTTRQWACPQTDRAIQYLAEVFEMGNFKWRSNSNSYNQPGQPYNVMLWQSSTP